MTIPDSIDDSAFDEVPPPFETLAPAARPAPAPKAEPKPVAKVNGHDPAIVSTEGMGKAPPHSLEDEEGLLSCCLLDGGETLRKASESLKPEVFSFPPNRIIFTKLLDMQDRKVPIETDALCSELTKAKQLDVIGGFPYLIQVTGRMATTISANTFIDRLRQLHVLREVIKLGKDAVGRAHDFGGNVTELTAEIRDRFAELDAQASGPGNPPRAPLPAIIAADTADRVQLVVPSQVVRGVLYQGGKLMLSAPSKARKTYVLIDLAVCVANGLGWLGKDTTSGGVLYVNFELQPFALQDRLRAICTAHKIGVPGNLHVWNLRGHLANLGRIRTELIACVRRLGIVLIIFDPVYKLLDGRSENDAAQIGELLNDIDSIALETGAAVAWAHHFAKGSASLKESIDRASGSGVWARDPDAILTLTPNASEDCLNVEMHLRNFTPVEPFAVRWQYPIWVCDSTVDPLDHKRPMAAGGPSRKTIDAVMRHVPEDGTIDRDLLIQTTREKEGIGERSAERMIAALVAKGQLYRWTKKRSKMRDAVSFGRTPQPSTPEAQ